MAETIFRVVKEDSLKGITPWDNPATMEVGYKAALPARIRLLNPNRYHWAVSIWQAQEALKDARYPQIRDRLRSLVEHHLPKTEE